MSPNPSFQGGKVLGFFDGSKANPIVPLIIPMMASLWVNKWKLYLASSMDITKVNLMNPLMVLMMALLWVHKWKLYLDS